MKNNATNKVYSDLQKSQDMRAQFVRLVEECGELEKDILKQVNVYTANLEQTCGLRLMLKDYEKKVGGEGDDLGGVQSVPEVIGVTRVELTPQTELSVIWETRDKYKEIIFTNKQKLQRVKKGLVEVEQLLLGCEGVKDAVGDVLVLKHEDGYRLAPNFGERKRNRWANKIKTSKHVINRIRLTQYFPPHTVTRNPQKKTNTSD